MSGSRGIEGIGDVRLHCAGTCQHDRWAGQLHRPGAGRSCRVGYTGKRASNFLVDSSVSDEEQPVVTVIG